ncbi:hypothetical protein AMELA_G00152340 [Ameiurus melas]|uniref:CCHC-type domain-containing protein n=1 Tax=Ameiurus melas TaxID=219545 RepID=A0A7J6AHU7_AMEME|nr:hypothetical protein AMELA_G00152340 [Ameiurus melas]
MPEFNGNRSNLEKHILKCLAEEENFEKDMEYTHPQKHFEHFITEKVNKDLTLDKLIDLAVRLDRLRRTNCPAPWNPVPTEPLPPTEPMQLGRARIHEVERERLRREEWCFYCGESTHFVRQCPQRRPRSTEEAAIDRGGPCQPTPLSPALIDSGAAEKFVHEQTACTLGLPIQALLQPRERRLETQTSRLRQLWDAKLVYRIQQL